MVFREGDRIWNIMYVCLDTGYWYCMKTLVEGSLYKWAHLSHVFSPYLSIGPEIVKCIEWAGGARGVSWFYLKEKKANKSNLWQLGSVSHWRWTLQTSALYTVFPSVLYSEKHMLNFHTVALPLPPYVGLEACAEKMVNVVLDYNSTNTADGDKAIFVYFNVWKSQLETLVCKNKSPKLHLVKFCSL